MAIVRLSEHFHLSEFTVSDTAARMGRKIEPTPEQIDAARALCVNVLEPVRGHFGAVILSSGIRPLWLNRIIGSSDNSQHVQGEASDFTCPRHPVEDVARWIADPANRIPFDQLIWEFDQWIHVSYSDRHRREVLTAKHDGTRTVYMPGMVPFNNETVG